ncbi:MAG: SURF1 family protein [Lysobacteraceae bacterium]
MNHGSAKWFWAMPALLLAAGFAALGFWQQSRGEQKREWLAAWEHALAAEPVPFAQATSRSEDSPPLRVQGELRFRAAPRMLLDNQQREGRIGVRAYALADTEGLAAPLLVELGWLPMEADRALPAFEVPQDPRHVSGVLVQMPGQGLKLGENPWKAGGDPVLLTYLSPEEIKAAAGTSLTPGLLRPDPQLPLGFARDTVLLPNTLPPERHYGYAVQWWGLSATVIVVYLVLAWRRKAR